MRGHDIIVIGTSAGGVGALRAILRSLPRDLPAAVFVVIHLAPHLPSQLAEVLKRYTRLAVHSVRGPTRFRKGTVYLAPPDHHLVLNRTRASLTRGPRENRHRPSVDVLFRTAAAHHGPRVIGVVLTGFLDDGTAGLVAIQAEGGLTLVQDPQDALFPDMPSNALQALRVDHCLPLNRIGPMLSSLAREPAAKGGRAPSPREARVEKAIAETTKSGLNGREALNRVGKPSTFTCPECQGPLWELRSGRLVRFRCQVGHGFTAESMLTTQQDVVERTLWAALGAIESRIALWKKITARMKGTHLRELAAFYRAKQSHAERDMAVLRGLLTDNRESRKAAGGRPGRSG